MDFSIFKVTVTPVKRAGYRVTVDNGTDELRVIWKRTKSSAEREALRLRIQFADYGLVLGDA